MADLKALAQAAIDAGSACAELKAAAQNYLDAAGTAGEKEAARILVAEAEEDICEIGPTIAFFESEAAKEIFGAEQAAAIAAHSREVQAAGGKYCDCPGCTAAKAIIDAKAEFLA